MKSVFRFVNREETLILSLGFSIWAVALNLVERSSSTSRMKAKCWTFTGITAIVAGTFGSHGFKPTDPVYKTVSPQI